MKEKVLLIFFLCNVALFVSAQSHMEKGLQSISRSSTEAIINFLAGDELQGREAGFHGSRVASEYIVSLLQWIGVQPLNESYFQPFEAYRKERQKKGRLEVHPDSIAKLKQEVHQKLSMRNVLGMIPGKNTKEYVIVGAHCIRCIANSKGICCHWKAAGKKCNLRILGRRRKRVAWLQIFCANLPFHLSNQRLSEL